MATIAIPRPHSFDRRQQSLLSLDCSADLRSYSRNLGPGVQERVFEGAGDALRAQLDEHREFLIRQHRSSQVQVVPVPRLDAPPPNAPAPFAGPLSNHARGQPHIAPLYGMANHQAPPYPQAQPSDPRYGHIETYPPELCEALGRCAALQQPDNDVDTVYHVMENTTAAWTSMEDVTNAIVKTYDTLQEANDELVRMFLEDYWGSSEGETREYDVLDSGGLKFTFETDGSLGGTTELCVRPQNLSRTRYSRKR